MKFERFLIAGVAVFMAIMWGRAMFDKRGQGVADSTARTLGIYSPHLPANQREQARESLAADARRREHRFIEAANPGSLMASTRIEQEAIDANTVPPADLYQYGAQLFHYRFRRADGFGSKDAPGLRRVQTGRRGGPDAYRCADCHRRGGPAGAGDAADNSYLDGDGDDVRSALERNPPPLTGAGVIELLAREMSEELRGQRKALVAGAEQQGARQRRELKSKGVSFGFLSAMPNGAVDARELAGIDPDLVVKPFGWKGHASTIREFVEDELLLHHGMESDFLVRHDSPDRIGRYGRGNSNSRPLDPDGDGVPHEITEGQVTALTMFVAMQELPEVGMPNNPARVADWTNGQQLFDKIGCAKCHTPSLPLRSAIYTLPSRDRRTVLSIDLAKHGADRRLSKPATDKNSDYLVYLYSDLKRHIVGPNLREARPYRGVSAAKFRTPPLWGIARSRPYLHDAHAPELEVAILEHSGEAQRSRDAFAALNESKRAKLRVFLTSLTRAPRIVSP